MEFLYYVAILKQFRFLFENMNVKNGNVKSMFVQKIVYFPLAYYIELLAQKLEHTLSLYS